MLQDGSYVRLLAAPMTRRGTIHKARNPAGREQFVFRLDPRFDEQLQDFYVFEDEVEQCERPSDEEVSLLRRSVKSG